MVAPGPTAAYDLRGVREHLQRLRERQQLSVLAIGEAYSVVGEADAYYHCDEQWWKAFADKMPANAPGRSFSLDATPHTQKFSHGLHFEITTEYPKIITGLHSGIQAMNVAYHFGARYLGLVGFNLQKVSGKTHFFGERKPGVLHCYSPYDRFAAIHVRAAPSFKAAGVTVFNCTTSSALLAYPHMDVNEFVWRAINDRFS